MKTKRQKRTLIAVLIFTLIAMYGFLPPVLNVNAVDSIKDAKDTISDSDLGVTATHTFNFTATTTPAGGYWDIDFPGLNAFTAIATTSVTCGYGDANLAEFFFESTNIVRCSAVGVQAGTTTQVVVTGVVSTSTPGQQFISITNYNASGVAIERVTVAVYIIDDILMTARVDSTLVFNIYGTTTSARVGGILCSNASTATNTPFGTLVVNATSTVCQMLEVTTNADDGFKVTVEQDNELLSDSGSNINSFDNSQNNTGSTTPHAWAVPNNILDNYHTYGHMGLFSDDSDLESDGGADFNTAGATLFAGLNGVAPLIVFAHNGPSDGLTQNKGHINILYQAQIASLQESGDYESKLTYICTPTY